VDPIGNRSNRCEFEAPTGWPEKPLRPCSPDSVLPPARSREAPSRQKVKGKRVYVNDARVITPDIRASNGIVHAINRVLIPPSLR